MSVAEAVERIDQRLHGLKSERYPFPEIARMQQPHIYDLNLARMAIAQLYRGTQTPTDSPELWNGIAKLARSLGSDGLLKRLWLDYWRTHPEREVMSPFDAGRFEFDLRSHPASEPDERFFYAFTYPTLQILNGHNSPLRELKNYGAGFSYGDRVTSASACVDVNRSAAEFSNLLDPRCWQANAPTLWLKSAALSQVPSDRSQDGASELSQKDQPLPDTALFEHAIWGWEVLPVTSYRNLLSVRFDITQHPSFTYRQLECLTSEFIGTPIAPGGIDVDHGFGDARDIAGTSFCRLTAQKCARFDLPKGRMNQFYNDIAAVALPLLIDCLVLFGALL